MAWNDIQVQVFVHGTFYKRITHNLRRQGNFVSIHAHEPMPCLLGPQDNVSPVLCKQFQAKIESTGDCWRADFTDAELFWQSPNELIYCPKEGE